MTILLFLNFISLTFINPNPSFLFPPLNHRRTAKRKREEKNEEEIDDVLLYELSEKIYEDRKKMALALGLNYVEEITPIEKKIPDDVIGQTFELFQRWKQRYMPYKGLKDERVIEWIFVYLGVD